MLSTGNSLYHFGFGRLLCDGFMGCLEEPGVCSAVCLFSHGKA